MDSTQVWQIFFISDLGIDATYTCINPHFCLLLVLRIKEQSITKKYLNQNKTSEHRSLVRIWQVSQKT